VRVLALIAVIFILDFTRRDIDNQLCELVCVERASMPGFSHFGHITL
jgi:hypothetical protein